MEAEKNRIRKGVQGFPSARDERMKIPVNSCTSKIDNLGGSDHRKMKETVRQRVPEFYQ